MTAERFDLKKLAQIVNEGKVLSTEQLLRLAIAACTNSMQLPIIINPVAKEEAFVYHEPFHTGESIDARGFAQSNFLQSLVFFYEHLPDETFEVFW